MAYVYILINASMHGQLKIGYTAAGTSEERAKELRGTGVPTPFTVVYEEELNEFYEEVEKETHERLKEFRVMDDREFFQVATKQAIAVLSEVAKKYQAQETKQKHNLDNKDWGRRHFEYKDRGSYTIEKEMERFRQNEQKRALYNRPTPTKDEIEIQAPKKLQQLQELQEFLKIFDLKNLCLSQSQPNDVQKSLKSIESAKWFKLSARAGNPKSQFILGVLYAGGYGVGQSYVLAYEWCNLAVTYFSIPDVKGCEELFTIRERIASYMSEEQIAAAEKFALVWKAT